MVGFGGVANRDLGDRSRWEGDCLVLEEGGRDFIVHLYLINKAF